MKTIKTYIYEILDSAEITKIKKLDVIYKVKFDNIIIKVPSNYSESDMKNYLDGVCIKEFPGSSQTSKNVLGDNIKNITDAYFEYEKFEASDKPIGNINIDWDPKYSENNDIDAFTYYKLKNLTYHILFSEFNLTNTPNYNIKEQLTKIFKTFNSNTTNKYPIEIELKDITYEQ